MCVLWFVNHLKQFLIVICAKPRPAQHHPPPPRQAASSQQPELAEWLNRDWGVECSHA